MRKTNYLHHGNEGAIYPIEGRSEVAKVFFIDLIVPDYYYSVIELKKTMNDLKSKKLNVPKIYEIVKINTSSLVIPKNFQKYAHLNKVSLENKYCPSFVKEYIEGTSLDNNYLHSFKLQSMIKKTYSEFHDAGYVITDARPSNFVLQKDTKELYVVDGGSIHSISDAKKSGLYKSSIHGFNTFWSDKGLIAYYIADYFVKKSCSVIKSKFKKDQI